MSKTSVSCIANSRTQAAQIVDGLRNEGFSNSDISALFPDRETSRNFAYEKHTKAPEGAATGAGARALQGGTLGWLARIASLAIPGVGPLIAAGPIVARLSGPAAGTATGGIAGAVSGLGIPENEAKRYEGKVKAGHILLSVHAENADEVARAKEVFKAGHARDIAMSGESSAPEPEDAEGGSDDKRARAETYSATPVTQRFCRRLATRRISQEQTPSVQFS